MQDLGVVGDLHFQTAHNHWHFEPFDHYELHRLDGTLVGSDVKQGFCLGDNRHAFGSGAAVYTEAANHYCEQGNTGAQRVTEGISVGWADFYEANLEGQDIPINPTAVPAGDYILIHRVNENPDGSPGPVHETTYSNNVGSLQIRIAWSSSGQPSIVSTSNGCSASPSCDRQPPQPPPGTPPPGLQPNDVRAPKLSFTKRTSERFKPKSRSVFVVVTCDEPCTLTAQGTVAIGGAAKAPLLTGKATMALPAGKRTKVVLKVARKLQRKIRRALRRHRSVNVKVAFTAVDGAGNRTTGARTIKLLR
jgi:hypothetical protein